mmetsp:Transcript_544/g.1240  ORF Transcript_544/g.1240 Transcript_544/m.1240 type:complete len:212 (-) Transcript_544:63-698(-)
MPLLLLLSLLASAANAFVSPSTEYLGGAADQSVKRGIVGVAGVAHARVRLNLGNFEEYEQDDFQDLAVLDTSPGSGDDTAEFGRVVTVSYAGRLMSDPPGSPNFNEGQITFRLGEGKVIPGWEKGVAGMRLGGRRTLRIPPSLAYGEKGREGVIPPNAHLEFDVEVTAMPTGVVDEKAAELSTMSPIRKAAVAFAVGSVVYDVGHFVMHAF